MTTLEARRLELVTLRALREWRSNHGIERRCRLEDALLRARAVLAAVAPVL